MAAPIEALVPESLERARRQAPPCAFVVFGATGDLTHRKLLPAIYNLAANGSLPERFGAVGVARREMSDEAFREGLHEGVEKFSRSGLDDAIWDRFASGVNYCQGHFDDPELYRRLAMQLEDLDKKLELGGNRLFYMAVPPSEFESILKGLRKAGLIYAPGERSWSRVIIEKPFGHDLESARELNALVASVLDESQAFRIDHYLGKETVQSEREVKDDRPPSLRRRRLVEHWSPARSAARLWRGSHRPSRLHSFARMPGTSVSKRRSTSLSHCIASEYRPPLPSTRRVSALPTHS
jgi:hypothetical protein